MYTTKAASCTRSTGRTLHRRHIAAYRHFGSGISRGWRQEAATHPAVSNNDGETLHGKHITDGAKEAGAPKRASKKAGSPNKGKIIRRVKIAVEVEGPALQKKTAREIAIERTRARDEAKKAQTQKIAGKRLTFRKIGLPKSETELGRETARLKELEHQEHEARQGDKSETTKDAKRPLIRYNPMVGTDNPSSISISNLPARTQVTGKTEDAPEDLSRPLIRYHRMAPRDEPSPISDPIPAEPVIRKVGVGSVLAYHEYLDSLKAAGLEPRNEPRPSTDTTYETTLPPSQIYAGIIKSLTPALLRSLAIEPDLPLLVRSPIPRQDLRTIAQNAGIPAISKWFRKDVTPSDSIFRPLDPRLDDPSPFRESYLNPLNPSTIFLPYELLTPILPTTNNGVHDTIALWSSLRQNSLLTHHLPPAPPLRDILSTCLDHAAYDAQDARYIPLISPFIRDDFLALIPGKPLDPLQWSLLQKYGSLFQTFHSFTAPLSLLLAAAHPQNSVTSPEPSLPGLYIAQAQLSDLPAAMQADLPLPTALASLHASDPLRKEKGREGADIYGANLWLGTPPTFTPLHKDPNPNFFIQLCGRKVVKLLPPAEGQRVFRDVQARISAQVGDGGIRGEEMMQGVEREELGREVWGDGEGGKGGRGEMVVLGPGDALFIPRGWWHSVKSVGSRVNGSVNWWFR